ncbi:hypothetical protein [Riemerella columbina]|uniref:hypothetical protein n=1 Tax=Riemerella columbina TaxID=103810 RepID=UPI0003784306|nr:hypothetical protein [Riemerella columbina]
MKSTIKSDTLKEIIEIEEFAGNYFQEQIDAIDNLFYYYIQECLHKERDILISCNEAFEIKEAKRTLRLLGQYLKEIK